ncbi:MAG: RagB/SusD family nutrient uptake outer membrane protein, partial [Phaeodactylibacter sp.]|nr:RagB/SusD family nutrient uptake outer membrane protein [Phaeodactylibacter sp.]
MSLFPVFLFKYTAYIGADNYEIGETAANYQIGLYPATVTQDYARKALRMERRLELHNEGHHFCDLVRDDRSDALQIEAGWRHTFSDEQSITVGFLGVLFPLAGVKEPPPLALLRSGTFALAKGKIT